MNLSDIYAHYKNRWVLARVTKQNAKGQPVEFEPLEAAPTKQEIEAKLQHCQEKHLTVVYTGKPGVRI